MKNHKPEAKITEDEAFIIESSKWYQRCSDVEIAAFQLYEPILWCPLDVYHKAVESSLNRPVMTHEFVDVERLVKEFEQKHSNANKLTEKMNTALTQALNSIRKAMKTQKTVVVA